MKTKITFFIAVMLFAANVCMGETFTYPGDSPLFSISFPDKWIVETDGELLSGTPDDESIYLGLWAIENSENLDDALDALDDIIEDLVTDFEAGDVEELEINDIFLYYVDGSGIDTEGDEVSVSAALFSPEGKMVCIIFYYGTPEAEAFHEDELVEILQSLELE